MRRLLAFAVILAICLTTSSALKRDSDDDDLENDSSPSNFDMERIASMLATDTPAATAPTPVSKTTMPTFEILDTTSRADTNQFEEDENKPNDQGSQGRPATQVGTSISVIRSLLKKEVRKLKSAITDSIMEEVINYYGKKLDMTDILARDMEKVNNRVSLLEENVTALNQNYKQLLKNHRNLVDMVRNNLVSGKKEKKPSQMSTLIDPSSGVKSPASSVFATIITDLLLNNKANKSISNNNNKSAATLTGTDLEAMTLRNHLINDLETKYANLVNQNLMGIMPNSYSVNRTTMPAVTPLDTSTLHLQLVEEVESEKGINFSTLLPKKGKSSSNGGDTRKIVIRNEDKKQSMSKSKKKSSSLRHKHVNHHQHSNNESVGIEDSMRSSKEQYRLKKVQKPLNATTTPEEMPRDCQDIRNRGVYRNGVYKVFSPMLNTSFDVYCEFEGNFGWTLLQHRFDGTTSFHQNWKAYKQGFGNLIGEFWLGLDYMNALTSQKNCSLQIIMTDWKNEVYRAVYTHFKVDDEKSKYKLEISGYVKEASNAGDSLAGGEDSSTATASNSANSYHQSAAYTTGNMDPIRNTPAPLGQSHQNMPFSTFDSDNDMRFYDNCAQLFKSGWWFNQCFQANLNGIYYTYKNAFQQQQIRFLRNGLHWNSIDFYKSLKSTKMRIKPADD